MDDLELRSIDLGDVTLSTVVHGPDDGPAVILLHGFPEIGYSWRHQIRPLADAGYRVVVPDQRGYGASTIPADVSDYTVHHLVGDVVGLIDTLSLRDPVVIGHDWGAIVTTHVGLIVPDRVRAIAAISVPMLPPLDQSILQIIDGQRNGGFHYMRYFQEPGLAEQELDGDAIGFLRKVLWFASGDRPADVVEPDPMTQTTWFGDLDAPAGLPPWLEAGDFEAFARAFVRNGFTAPLNWYRNLHRNWELTRAWRNRPIDLPTAFIGGLSDFVVNGGTDGEVGAGVQFMQVLCTDLRRCDLLEGVGHWTQQEAPDEVNASLLAFLADVHG